MHMQQQQQQQQQQKLVSNFREGHPFSTEEIKNLVAKIDHLLTAYGIKAIDVSNILNGITAKKIYRANLTQPTLVIAQRTDKNSVPFSWRTKDPNENMLVVYGNHYRCFNYDKELSAAVQEIEKMLKS